MPELPRYPYRPEPAYTMVFATRPGDEDSHDTEFPD